MLHLYNNNIVGVLKHHSFKENKSVLPYLINMCEQYWLYNMTVHGFPFLLLIFFYSDVLEIMLRSNKYYI